MADLDKLSVKVDRPEMTLRLAAGNERIPQRPILACNGVEVPVSEFSLHHDADGLPFVRVAIPVTYAD